MRIYGGRDYYDCGMALGIDRTITLLRGQKSNLDTEHLVIAREELRLWGQGCGRYFGLEAQTIAVAFCDKLYHGAICGNEYMWSATKLREWVAKTKNLHVEIVRPWRERNPSSLETFFEPLPISDSLREWVILHKVSILIDRPAKFRSAREVLVNPAGLKQIGFAKALDPYTAFQVLSMWIGGVLGGTSPEIVKITDDLVLAQSHGFDKNSFRGPRIK